METVIYEGRKVGKKIEGYCEACGNPVGIYVDLDTDKFITSFTDCSCEDTTEMNDSEEVVSEF